MNDYRAKIDTIVDGKPAREGEDIKGLTAEKAEAYEKAGLIEKIGKDSEAVAAKGKDKNKE